MISIPLALSVGATQPVTPARKKKSETLFESAIVRVTVENKKTMPIRMLSICAIDGSLSIDTDSVDGTIKATETLMNDGEPFCTVWNLQLCPVPHVSIIFKCLRWAMSNKCRLDTYNKRMAVVLPENRPVILEVVNGVVSAFQPQCPVRATSSLVDAVSFLENCG
jgi:hypothetical protein